MVCYHQNLNERYPWANSKLKQEKYGSFKITKKINDNVYMVDLSTSMSIFKTFNVADIYLYCHETEFEYLDRNSRLDSSEVDVNDEDTY